jgi:hypothetical protein
MLKDDDRFLEASKNRDGKAQHIIPGLFSKSFRADSGLRFDRGTVPVRQSPGLETLWRALPGDLN